MKTTSRSTLLLLTRVSPRKAARPPALLLVLLICLAALLAGVVAQTAAAATISFTGQEFLGRPTSTSISVKVVPDANCSLYYECGTTSGVYTKQTSTTAATAGQPVVVDITGLSANTHYYYHMKYSTDGGSTWTTRAEHSFWTQRAKGSTFTFDITTDGHVNIMLGNAGNWQTVLNNVAGDHPDFDIDLGDTTAMDDGNTSVGSVAEAEQVYKDTLPYLNTVSASAPLFMVAGNHEQQEAWHGTTAADDLPIMGKNAEKKFFLNPVPNSFYSGDSRTISLLSGDHLVQDYYSWTWGDALFVVVSPYWTTTTKPYTTSTGGGEGDTTGSGDRWDWTLGADQFNWLKTTLANSDAKYKFVFAHQIVGGNSMSNQVNYGHGGVDSANFVEWGGYNVDGTTYAWSAHRDTSVWGNKPIREMMEANGVSAFFHGHDHQMAYETANDMVYQACPSASFSGSFGNYTTGDDFTVRNETGGTSTGHTVWADSTQGPGRLRVTVAPAQTTVEFVRYDQTSTAAYSYTMAPTSGPYTLTYTAGAHGSINGVSPQTVARGANGTSVQAVPAAGYHFVKWDDGSTANPRTDTNVTKNITVTAQFASDSAVSPDGTPSSGTGAGGSSTLSFSHTTGTGNNRLMLVGVSWNCGTTDRTISSVTFTPSGGSATNLTQVITQLGYSSSNPRYSAIYKLLNPPSGVTGTVTVTFSGAVSNGSVAGAADFSNVDQTTPLGTPGGVGSASNTSTSMSVDLSGLNGNELVFDNVFAGASGSTQTLTPGAGQTALWNVLNYASSPASNIIAGASTEQATGSSVTMSWTFSSAAAAITAVPINPQAASPFNSITVSAPTGTTSLAQGASLPVSWTTNAAVSTGEFSIWVVSTGNSWYGGTIVANNGTSTYSNKSITVDAPVGTGYKIYVYWRATIGSGSWTLYGLAPGTVNVTAPGFNSITVSAPTGTTSLAQGASLPVSWTTNAAVSTGEFSIWVVSTGNSWYGGTIVANNGTSTYSNKSITVDAPVGTGYKIYVYWRATIGSGSWTLYGLAPGTVNVTAAGFNTITVTAPPTGITSKAQGAALPVAWTTNATVASGQFSTWVVSTGGNWYVGQIKAADGTASYSDSVALNVPVDTGYKVYVYYRATSGDAWTLYGLAPGTVNVTAAGFNTITVTAPPTGITSKAQGAALPVAWTTNATVASGQFSTWVVSTGGNWYVGQIKAADGTASYSDSVALNVPVDTGYKVYVYYRATSGDAWTLYGLAPGTVNVTAAGFNTITVTAPPTGITSKAQGAALPVAWTTNATVASGQFSTWVVSTGGNWYVGQIKAADGTASYSDSVALNVPVDTGYKVYVYYRATSGDAWTLYGLAPGTVNVTAAGFNTITVTAPPTGITSKAQGAALPVAWTTNATVASGQFSTWVVSTGGNWYVGQIKAADGTASYSDSVALNVPVDTGYKVYVYYRATSGDAWTLYGLAPGTVNVTGP